MSSNSIPSFIRLDPVIFEESHKTKYLYRYHNLTKCKNKTNQGSKSAATKVLLLKIINLQILLNLIKILRDKTLDDRLMYTLNVT